MRTTNSVVIRCKPQAASGSSTSAASSSPVAHRVRNSTPTARTNGSANGSSMRGWAALAALALPAATSVAVAPTPVARSQLSSSVRATDPSSARSGRQRSAVDPNNRLQLRDEYR
ncbi:Uncharacterised protein [Mycobacterium tuberculosis]|uniref:Uncharacterized protein n=3 Tax=Mycobacterium tuberculosis TaxID=1773 RepID=A0A0U0RBL3_MYCTX|nr:Uncharacterised protein [Mycobacterium tuberculosis]COV95453.1 Uncharacterised protein [Mycobacterium tuberculosis]COZ02497.1 Uncharacterised protein [Mycobacterium tuberculosis]